MLTTRSTAEAVLNHFVEQIQSGQLRPGDKLPSERVLQEQLGISRFTLREGLARLSALGLIEVRHGKGAVVSDEISVDSLKGVIGSFFPAHDPSAFQELYEARVLLEGELSRLAALRRTEDHLEKLRGIIGQARRKLDDRSAFADCDFQFHHVIADASGNKLLQKMHEAIADQAAKFILPAMTRTHREEATIAHAEILGAIEKGDAAAAMQAAREHLVACRKNYDDYTAQQLKDS